MNDIAIFDLDYTLTKRGTWGRFVLKNLKSKPHLWIRFALCTGKAQWLYVQRKTTRVSVKQEMMRCSMVGNRKEDIIHLAEDFAENEVRMGMRTGALKSLKYHSDKGDTIVIASAAVCVIVEAIARRLNISHWVATDMKWENGRLSPGFESENCYAQEKLKRIEALFVENPNLKQKNTHITMYSDSYSDLPTLRYSNKGNAVNPDRKLRKAAKSENIAILKW